MILRATDGGPSGTGTTTRDEPAPGSKGAAASLLLGTKPEWRSRASTRLALPDRTLRRWIGSGKSGLWPYAAIIGYCTCAMDARTAAEVNFGLDHERLAWIRMWDLAYGVGTDDLLASLLGETRRTVQDHARRTTADADEATRAVWVRIGLTWLAGGVEASPAPAYGGDPPNRGRITTLEARIRETTRGDRARLLRVGALASTLVGVCVEGGRHA
jgi:hypothetical protein